MAWSPSIMLRKLSVPDRPCPCASSKAVTSRCTRIQRRQETRLPSSCNRAGGMNRATLMLGSLVSLGLVIGSSQGMVQRDEMPAGHPQSIEPELQTLLGRLRDQPSSPELLGKMRSAYVDLADDYLTEKVQRQAAFEEGAKAAEKAFQIDESNADAHFFHALNLGNAARLRGATSGALVVNEIKSCVGR